MGKNPVAIGPSVAPPPVGNPFKAPKPPPSFTRPPKAKMPFPHRANKAKMEKAKDPRRPAPKPRPPMSISQAMQRGMAKC